MRNAEKVRLTRRDMLKLSGAGAGLFALTASGFAVPRGIASGGPVYLEAFPTSPLILNPFTDFIESPRALAPVNTDTWDSLGNSSVDTKHPNKDRQDCLGRLTTSDDKYLGTYGVPMGTHQRWSNDVPGGPADPIYHQIKVQINKHKFTSSLVQPIDSNGKNVVPPGSRDSSPRLLPDSTIYGFNGSFPGPRINAEYRKPLCVRFENHLTDENIRGYDLQDFGAPNRAFLTHLHNGHTAPESDGQPHYASFRFATADRKEHYEKAWEPGEWVDQLYLGYPAGGDSREIQSFFWFHDHVHGHTGANVYKGMVGLMPIYDSVKIDGDPLSGLDPGDETKGLRLPGVRHDHANGHFDVDYDIPFALYDCRLDDGATPHKDAHNGNGETHPEWWGKTYFRHFPNHGFVGDIFTVNGTAYPVMKVKRRKYRLRFLDASISRIYNLQFMTSQKGPVAARDLGYSGDELQGQQRLPDGQAVTGAMVQIANEGGLLPYAVKRDSFELWPAKRREFIVDFTSIAKDPTKDTVVYLVNTMKMTTGRMWDSNDPNFKVPLMKIIIEKDPNLEYAPGRSPAGPNTDLSLIPIPFGHPTLKPTPLRPAPSTAPLFPDVATAFKSINDKSIPSFELQRGSVPVVEATDAETEWLINGQQFDATKPLITVSGETRTKGALWRIRNGGGGWVHPMHLHMEEHQMVARNGKPAPDARHPDDGGKEDVVALDPSEDTVIFRRFRTFTGPYVAHCHNLAHEDHNMMFGWDIKA